MGLPFGDSSLTLYARQDEALALQELAAGANPNHQNDFGITALHLACKHGFVRLVDALVERGASVLQKDKEGRTPVQLAEGRWPVCQRLLQFKGEESEAVLRGLAEVTARVGSLVQAQLVFSAATAILTPSDRRTVLDAAVTACNMPGIRAALHAFPELLPEDAWYGFSMDLGHVYRETSWLRSTTVSLYSLHQDKVANFDPDSVRSTLTSLAGYLKRHKRAACESDERIFVYSMYLTRGRARKGWREQGRNTHCWHCKTAISDAVNPICPLCGWIRCPQGACREGCPASSMFSAN